MKVVVSTGHSKLTTTPHHRAPQPERIGAFHIATRDARLCQPASHCKKRLFKLLSECDIAHSSCASRRWRRHPATRAVSRQPSASPSHGKGRLRPGIQRQEEANCCAGTLQLAGQGRDEVHALAPAHQSQRLASGSRESNAMTRDVH